METLYIESSDTISSLNDYLYVSTTRLQNTLYGIYDYYTTLDPIQDYTTLSQVKMNTVQTSSLSGISSLTTSTFMNIYGLNISQPMLGKQSIHLPTFDIYDTNTSPLSYSNHFLLIQNSNIIFNNAFTIKDGRVGINTLTPEYALDIGDGDARKLNTIYWINPSDQRIKHLEDLDESKLFNEIVGLRLVSYTWSETYRESKGLSASPQLGFLSQEVESIFPKSVLQKSENGFDDFRSLDTDQLIKAKFGLTQQLLGRVSTLQSRINILYEY